MIIFTVLCSFKIKQFLKFSSLYNYLKHKKNCGNIIAGVFFLNKGM